MRDPGCVPLRAGSDQSEFGAVAPADAAAPFNFNLPFRLGSGADTSDVVPGGAAYSPVPGSIILGQGFADTSHKGASAAARYGVVARVARLGESKSEGFAATVGLELGGTACRVILRARGLLQASVLDTTMAERRDLAGIVLEAEEAERRRIARDLHDETAQQLAAMQLRLAKLRECGADDEFDSTCGHMEEMLRAVMNELRTLSYVLHPPEIDDAGLVEAMRRFVKGFARRTRLKTTFVDATRGVLTDGVTDRALYRVTQEALTNVGRHAEATTAMVSLCQNGPWLELEVEDDGIGISRELCASRSDANLGVGLSAMRERIEALAGKLEVSRLSTGTRVRAILPIGARGGTALIRPL